MASIRTEADNTVETDKLSNFRNTLLGYVRTYIDPIWADAILAADTSHHFTTMAEEPPFVRYVKSLLNFLNSTQRIHAQFKLVKKDATYLSALGSLAGDTLMLAKSSLTSNQSADSKQTVEIINTQDRIQDNLKIVSGHSLNMMAWAKLAQETVALARSAGIPPEIRDFIKTLPNLRTIIASAPIDAEDKSPAETKVNVKNEMASLYRSLRRVAHPTKNNITHSVTGLGPLENAVNTLNKTIKKVSGESQLLIKMSDVAKKLDALALLGDNRKDKFSSTMGAFEWMREATRLISQAAAEIKQLNSLIKDSASSILFPAIKTFIYQLNSTLSSLMLKMDKFELDMGLKLGSVTDQFSPMLNQLQSFIISTGLPIADHLQPPYWNDRLFQLQHVEASHLVSTRKIATLKKAITDNNSAEIQRISSDIKASRDYLRFPDEVQAYIENQISSVAPKMHPTDLASRLVGAAGQAAATSADVGRSLVKGAYSLLNRTPPTILQSASDVVITQLSNLADNFERQQVQLQSRKTQMQKAAVEQNKIQQMIAHNALSDLTNGLNKLLNHLNKQKSLGVFNRLQWDLNYQINTLLEALQDFEQLSFSKSYNQIYVETDAFFKKAMSDVRFNKNESIKMTLRALHKNNYLLRKKHDQDAILLNSATLAGVEFKDAKAKDSPLIIIPPAVEVTLSSASLLQSSPTEHTRGIRMEPPAIQPAHTDLIALRESVLTYVKGYITPFWAKQILDQEPSAHFSYTDQEPVAVRYAKSILNVLNAVLQISQAKTLKAHIQNVFVWKNLLLELQTLAKVGLPLEIREVVKHLAVPTWSVSLEAAEAKSTSTSSSSVKDDITSLYRSIRKLADPAASHRTPITPETFTKAVKNVREKLGDSELLHEFAHVAKNLDQLISLSDERQDRCTTTFGTLGWIQDVTKLISQIGKQIKALHEQLSGKARAILPNIHDIILSINNFFKTFMLNIDKFECESGLKLGSISLKFNPFLYQFQSFIEVTKMPLADELQPPYWQARELQLQQLELAKNADAAKITALKQAIAAHNIDLARTELITLSANTRVPQSVCKHVTEMAPIAGQSVIESQVARPGLVSQTLEMGRRLFFGAMSAGNRMLPTAYAASEASVSYVSRADMAQERSRNAALLELSQTGSFMQHQVDELHATQLQMQAAAAKDQKIERTLALHMLTHLIAGLKSLTEQLQQEKWAIFNMLQTGKNYKIKTLTFFIKTLEDLQSQPAKMIHAHIDTFFNAALADVALNKGEKVRAKLKTLHKEYFLSRRKSDIDAAALRDAPPKAFQLLADNERSAYALVGQSLHAAKSGSDQHPASVFKPVVTSPRKSL